MDALLIGRFQPWHLGHQKCIEEIRQYNPDAIIIGLRPMGAREGDFLTIEQRIEIIKIAVPDALVVAMADIPDYDVGFSCNPEVQAIYRQQGKRVIELPRYGYSATEVRRRLAFGLNINDLVAPGTAEIIWQLYKNRVGV